MKNVKDGIKKAFMESVEPGKGSFMRQLMNIAKEEDKIREEKPLPEMTKIPLNHYDLACPLCGTIMHEKDFSFKYNPELHAYTHCDPNKPFRMPK